MKNVHIDDWLSDIVNDGCLKNGEELLIKVSGREIVILETVFHSDGELDFKVVSLRC